MRNETATRFLLRLPADMMVALRRAARDNDRTVTGEIIHRLRATLDTAPVDDSRAALHV